MTRDEIVQLIVSYSKRPDLQTEIEDYFLKLSESRIGRDLRAFENETKADVAFPADSNVAPLPADYGNVRAVYPPGGGGRALDSVDILTLSNYRQTGNANGVYNIRGTGGSGGAETSEIEVRPYKGSTLPVYYFARPQFGANGEANAVSVRWPQVYLYAALIELHIWEKNAEALRFVNGLYGPEVKTINRDAERARGSKPAMRIG